MTQRHFNSTVLEGVSTFAIAVAGDVPTIGDDNIIRGLKIFRTGTFPDSRGRVTTWTRDHLSSAAKHFADLATANILPNVPVREDHTDRMKDVIGYYTKVYVDPTNNDMLLADVELTEPKAIEKWKNKTYRNRSIEIGRYPSMTTGEVYEPVVLGLAFVDLPAVEGLFRHPLSTQTPDGDQSLSGQSDPKEHHMPGESTAFKFQLDGKEVSDPAAVQAALTKMETELTRFRTGNAHTFKIGGQDVSDFAAVQKYITEVESELTTLKTFQKETIESGRTTFVDNLAKANVITAPQAEVFKKLALGYTAEQFTDFCKAYEGALPANLFAKHDTDGTNGSASGREAEHIQLLRDMVANHKLSGGFTEEQLKNTATYKELMQLTNGKG